jgi:hypothetical protein
MLEEFELLKAELLYFTITYFKVFMLIVNF